MRVLGISPAHDSSICVWKDNRLEFFAKEERFSRVKRDRMPWNCIDMVEGKIDAIAIASPTSDFSNVYLKQILEKKFNCPVYDYSDKHHLCHAALAYYNSNFAKSLVFVIDRNGSVVEDVMREAETVFLAEYPEFKVLHKNYWVFNTGADADHQTLAVTNKMKFKGDSFNADSTMSIVKVYESATSLIGQHPLENGKTMGLASYGEDKPFVDLFSRNRPNDNLFVHDYFVEKDQTTTLFRDHIGLTTTEVDPDNYQEYADYAYQVQKQTQEQVLALIKKYVEQTGIKEVCVTGGYALNVVANSYLVKNLPDVKFYFEPLADDSGNSIGAAQHLYRSITGDSSLSFVTDNTCFHTWQPYLDKTIGSDVTLNDIVELLIAQKTVAIFNSRAEAGPRALGNRSILFDARNKNAKEIVNKIKKREWYRPFAAMVLKEDFEKYFDTIGMESCPFMNMSFDVKLPEEIPGVVHVDNSCRVQTVSMIDYPHIMVDILTLFKEKTGCSVLLNTSFNLAGEPLVETQEDAIRTFNNSDIDVLWFPQIGKYLKKDTL